MENTTYNAFWDKCNKGLSCKGDYKAMHEALLKFEKYCEDYDGDNYDELKPSSEVDAMIKSAGLKETSNFALCHQDNWSVLYGKKGPEYYFVWDSGNVVWNFPGDYKGNINF